MKIAKKWKWMAKDKNGSVYLYQGKPKKLTNGWNQDHGFACFVPFEIKGGWAKSLQKRIGDDWVRVDK